MASEAASVWMFAMVAITTVWSMPADYAAARQALVHSEQEMRTGGTGESSLTPAERIVNSIMMEEKRKLYDLARLNGSDFAARNSFLNQTAKAAMERTNAFKIIRKMPKGGVLHVHDEALTSLEWLVKNVTYRASCYMCVTNTYNVKFHFYSASPSDPECAWETVANYRANSGDPDAFDQSLLRNLSMVTPDPARAYPDVNAAWGRFMDYFGKVEGLMLYAPVFVDYLWEGLKEFRDDNVQYLEIRGLLPQVYELDGTVHNADWVLNVYKSKVSQFVQMYPDFTGARFIKTSLRFKPNNQMLEDVKEAVRLYKDNQDFVVGFDLVGQEDPLHPLQYYVDDLLYPYKLDPPVHLPYFFHAGETNWQETDVDYNLVDALLLNTTRIGHGYALYKHPLLKQKLKEKDIAIEINPISNQVLKLVDDPRNHPATALLAEDYPLVISSDDPPVWEALPLSHDFYVTFMALTGEQAGLATLKRLALNSLRYSALGALEKQKAIFDWHRKWDRFIDEIVHEYMHGNPTLQTLLAHNTPIIG